MALRATPAVGQGAADTPAPRPTTVESALADRVAGCYEVATDEARTDTSVCEDRTRATATWVRLPGNEDRIVVPRPLPMAGLVLHVTPRGADLVGEITAFTDAIPPDGINVASHAIVAR